MGAFQNSYNYESLLENLRATHDTRKRRFEEKKHLMSDEDKTFEKFLFSLEADVLARKDIPEKEVVQFNFDELMNEISGVDVQDYSDQTRDFETSSGNGSERKHTCTHPGCNKSYTSSHGLKYHLLHGHSKDKENVYKPFVCTIPKCGKAYRNSNGLKYHMANAHSRNAKQ
ncbi:uncharacterized protein VICG_01311 [Vittaforma corneae ATCC 50505]|uniref:C2H2-type domain-containing protein n=1 Tax=Vittaforma corneae (strain ATCC 50505) TaxID=993615 RepID=L2GLC4_VITCO|nr:uncharacterized protein VICG_01311 [Vittaforma corneae ATCC 50505]ELA41678.1 hypothetical protein VICG_01311 [Vittaforma corneae ATCC 50505]